MIIDKLYRGDKRQNGTLVEKYRSAGLISKMIDGGDPMFIQRNGLIEGIKAHVDPLNENHIKFHNTTHFLSFSASYERAKYFAASGKPEQLLRCNDYEEQRCIFSLDISSRKIISDEAGLYYLEYNCNRKLLQSDEPAEILLGILLRNQPCNFCNKNRKHTILLIDVVKHLKNLNDKDNYSNWIKLATRDTEWLIMCTDYYADLYGNSAIIPRSNLWTAEHFRLKTEPVRDLSNDGTMWFS
jgi:hypothetical protein